MCRFLKHHFFIKNNNFLQNLRILQNLQSNVILLLITHHDNFNLSIIYDIFNLRSSGCSVHRNDGRPGSKCCKIDNQIFGFILRKLRYTMLFGNTKFNKRFSHCQYLIRKFIPA